MTIQFRWNDEAFYQMRRDPRVQAALENLGKHIVDEANATLPDGDAGYGMSSRQGARKPQGRWAVRVYTVSDHAKRSDAKHDTLMRILLGS